MPSIVAIGDLQGCAASLEQLFERIDSAPQRRWWFCGDLVNRGPASLASLRRLMSLGERAVAVLGNHDLHLLGIAAGARELQSADTVSDVLAAPDCKALIDWLRHRPLAHHEHGHLLVHAGVLPQWSLEQTLALAGEVEARLRGPDWKRFLRDLYGGKSPTRWDDRLSGIERARVIVNGLTRIRLCDARGDMALKNTSAPTQAPAGLMPWFDVPGRRTADTTIVFGHWSTLGLKLAPHLVGLDTGCVWGGKLTAVELSDDPGQRRLWQIACPEAQRPGADG